MQAYWALPPRAAARLRSPIFVLLKAAQTWAYLYPLSNDYWGPASGPQPWPLFLFYLCFTARVRRAALVTARSSLTTAQAAAGYCCAARAE